jgi:autotransporter-associated beta strand protein
MKSKLPSRFLLIGCSLAALSVADHAFGDLYIERTVSVNEQVPDRGQLVSSIDWPIAIFDAITSVSVNLQLSSANASNPMWLGDLTSILTHGTASENERVATLFSRPGVTGQNPFGSSASSLNQSYTIESALDGALLDSNRWSLLVSDQRQGGIARLDSWTIGVIGSAPQSGELAPGSGGSVQIAGGKQQYDVERPVALGTFTGNNAVKAIANNGQTMRWTSGITGSGELRKQGSGKLVIGGDSNAFTGTLKIEEGVIEIASGGRIAGNAQASSGSNLKVDGSIGGTVDIASGATLAGTGTIEGATTVSGDHTPGASPGLQTFENGLTYNASAVLEWELSANTASIASSGVLFDAINVTGGNLTIDSGATLNLVFTSPLSNNDPSTVTWFDSFWDISRSWTIIDYTGDGSSTGNFTLGTIGTALGGWSYDTVRPGSGFSVSNDSGDIVLNWTTAVAIPEPSASLMAMLGLTGLCLRRRVRAR